MAVMVVHRITPTILTIIIKTPFGFGPSKTGVTPGGGGDDVAFVASQAARLKGVVVTKEADVDDIVGMADVTVDVLAMADGEK